MLLQDSQGRSPQLSKNLCRSNILIIAWEYERNIQPNIVMLIKMNINDRNAYSLKY